MSDKGFVLEALQALPGDATWADILDCVETLAAIRRGEEAVKANRVIPHEQVKNRVAAWLGKHRSE